MFLGLSNPIDNSNPGLVEQPLQLVSDPVDNFQNLSLIRAQYYLVRNF